jgi:hypothetical protein
MEKKLFVLGFFIFISAYPILYIGFNAGFNLFFYWTSIGLGIIGSLLMISGLLIYFIKRKSKKEEDY